VFWPVVSTVWSAAMSRSHRYPIDLSDTEWIILLPLLPPAPTGGRPRKWPLRPILDGIFYIGRGGWRGGCCPATSRRGRPSTTASGKGRMRSRRRASSTANRSKGRVWEAFEATMEQRSSPDARVICWWRCWDSPCVRRYMPLALDGIACHRRRSDFEECRRGAGGQNARSGGWDRADDWRRNMSGWVRRARR
jgi:transposase